MHPPRREKRGCYHNADGVFVSAKTEFFSVFVDSFSRLPQNTASFSEGFPSGQRDQTVNLTAQPSEVRILPPPPKRIRPGRLDAEGRSIGDCTREGQKACRAVFARLSKIDQEAVERSGGQDLGGLCVVKVRCGCSSMVEPQPSKLIMWVRFPSPAPV